jgi:glutaminyl-tRNA synthetase
VEEGHDFKENINPDSLKVITAYAESSVLSANAGDRFQFERLGYFCVDTDTNDDNIVFNRTVALKDTWTKSDKA